MKNLTWQNPEQLFVAQELINKVKSKCCGIKDKVVSMSKTLYLLALSSVISLDIAAMSIPPHFSAGSGMARGAIVAKLPLKDGYGFERKNGIGRKLNTFCDDNKAKVTKLEEF